MRGLTNIIIPAIEINDELLKCLTEINKINFSNFFVSILLDRNSKRKIPKFRYKLNKLVVGKINMSKKEILQQKNLDQNISHLLIAMHILIEIGLN